jgi:hypothetical protein
LHFFFWKEKKKQNTYKKSRNHQGAIYRNFVLKTGSIAAEVPTKKMDKSATLGYFSKQRRKN